MTDALIAALRPEAGEAPESQIVAVVNHGREKPDIIPLWAGEGDLPTPDFICEAATRSLAAGETFYTYQRGIPELRAALADYYEKHFEVRMPAERFIVCGSGMQSIHMAVRMTAGTGDTIVVPSPTWPNAPASIELNGAKARTVPMTFDVSGWTLDLQAVMDACDATTKAIFVNSPSNPTGWIMPLDDMRALLDFARARGLWIIADEIYTRYVYGDMPRSLSFLDIADPEDRILYCNTFSKNWAMTGWRVGWLVIPQALGQVCENLIQYNTSGVPAFLQRACVAALSRGDDFVDFQVRRAREGRAIVCDALSASNRIELARPGGAFYAFFAVTGIDDTRGLAIRLVDEAGVGLAPGVAFGPGGERFMRLCFARHAGDLSKAMDRLTDWLNNHPA